MANQDYEEEELARRTKEANETIARRTAAQKALDNGENPRAVRTRDKNNEPISR